MLWSLQLLVELSLNIFLKDLSLTLYLSLLELMNITYSIKSWIIKTHYVTFVNIVTITIVGINKLSVDDNFLSVW